MNAAQLEKLFQNYEEKFDLINSPENHEYYKWEAVKQFHDAWDIAAPDFVGMFKRAISKTDNLINNRVMQPANGLLKLAERPELTEEVRELFRDLLETDDGGDIDQRQERIERFADSVNALLDRFEPGRWKYRQDLRSVLFYLNLYAPADNYIFKATPARQFMYCVEFGDDFGSGSTFRLSRYYRMCDWLVEQIGQRPSLMALHEDRLTDTMFREDRFHILAFDIIYNALACGLYNSIEVRRPHRTTAKEQEVLARIEELEGELRVLTERLDALLAERALYDDFTALGLAVRHRSFGKGKVTAQEDGVITVQFKAGTKRFLLPSSFTSGYLSTTDREAAEIMTRMTELDGQVEDARAAVREKQRRIDLLT